MGNGSNRTRGLKGGGDPTDRPLDALAASAKWAQFKAANDNKMPLSLRLRRVLLLAAVLAAGLWLIRSGYR